MSVLTEMRKLLGESAKSLNFKRYPGSFLVHCKGAYIRRGRKIFRIEHVNAPDAIQKIELSLLPVKEEDVVAGRVVDDYTKEVVKKFDRAETYEIARD